jgi:hypothetical protein
LFVGGQEDELGIDIVTVEGGEGEGIVVYMRGFPLRIIAGEGRIFVGAEAQMEPTGNGGEYMLTVLG